MNLGPDAFRYWSAGDGVPVPRPFHLRWLLPKLCGQHPRRWWAVWAVSWPLAAVGMIGWQHDNGWAVALAAAGFLLALSGILGPAVSIPVQVDLPATAMTLIGCALFDWSWMAAVAVFAVAASIRETAPVWAALWLWHPVALLGLAPVIVAAVVIRPGPDPTGDPALQHIADHPVRSALEYHAGRWRDGWLMVAPWGITLAALIYPDWRLVVVLVVAYLQLVVATDTVRLLHHAAGPPMAAAAAVAIPSGWLLLAFVAHAVFWRAPERV